ncbi:unnamed protein product [Clonostachys rosea]|uniref:Uncharacterized protein n=1 Tax=Bionectria ochroleuca TaxID=29856 RepID=A0ABY6UGA7_BIOOC|nr:unnamed protein product [Clonostachys rosea]
MPPKRTLSSDRATAALDSNIHGRPAKNGPTPLTAKALDKFNRKNLAESKRLWRIEKLEINRTRVAELEAKYRSRDLESEQLKRFAKGGGPNLNDLRQFSAPFSRTVYLADSSSNEQSDSEQESYESTRSSTTHSSSTKVYYGKLHQHLNDNDIYFHECRFGPRKLPEPTNLAEFRAALLSPQTPPVTFSDEDFESFRCQYENCVNETTFFEDLMPILQGPIQRQMQRLYESRFWNLDDLTDGTLEPAKPDLCHGASTRQIDVSIRQQLAGKIVPSMKDRVIVAPNFFGELKGPFAPENFDKVQILYDMALGERGQMALRNFGKTKPVYNGEGHTLGCTCNGSTLKIFAMSIWPPYKQKEVSR